ncbi:DUF4118 domain-containing protein, partial [Mycobacterium tuberculosis]|nr:DUF4118 domain-containing protein [Mycobacterium tuberculosis]
MAFEAANLVMLYLLGVVLIALVYGRWPSVLATVINVISFDLFFVAPRGTLAVSDVQYLLTFGVMLTVGLLGPKSQPVFLGLAVKLGAGVRV